MNTQTQSDWFKTMQAVPLHQNYDPDGDGEEEALR